MWGKIDIINASGQSVITGIPGGHFDHHADGHADMHADASVK